VNDREVEAVNAEPANETAFRELAAAPQMGRLKFFSIEDSNHREADDKTRRAYQPHVDGLHLPEHPGEQDVRHETSG
jgi:hypothetical protein